jgi:hypothetical protein
MATKTPAKAKAKTSKRPARVPKTEPRPATKASAKRAATKAKQPASKGARTRKAKPVLLSSGNPQIAKADGDAPVQAYIAAMPGWKHAVGRRLDTLITRTVPGLQKAVKWNMPLYGLEGRGFFLSYYCFTNYVKVTFFRGTSLRPVPPVASKTQGTRYLHIHEDEPLDEKQFTSWVRQAAALPGWIP